MVECTFIIGIWDGKGDWTIVGDVNLFFTNDEDFTMAEIEVMVAENTARGKGIGLER